MQNVAILGSTGSIGTQTLEVVEANRDQFSVTVLTAYNNDELLERQIEKFKPEVAVLVDDTAAVRLNKRYKGTTTILSGEAGLLEAAVHSPTNIVVTAMVGFAGLKPTIEAIKAKKNIALANKETLVAAGEIVMPLAQINGVKILPVDSEHSALFQCLQGEKSSTVKKLILTASGGPFRGYTPEQLEDISVEQCLKHPNWSMGRKITVDSASLVNKGLEVIEARWLYDVNYDNIEVVVHPQSIVHSMIEFVDGSIIAQMGKPDMKLPIQYALTYPHRIPSLTPKLDWAQMLSLEFMPPDSKTFRGLSLAYQAGRHGGTMPCVFNAANEVAVNAFLKNSIPFPAIYTIIEKTMDCHKAVFRPNLDEVFAADSWARAYSCQLLNNANLIK